MFIITTSCYCQSDRETDEQSYILGFTPIYYDMLLRLDNHIDTVEFNSEQ
ncbi:hypothetical protein NIES4073_14410 [Kalymmatonema gypsitolerans NIES-4073]|nr:hypothetical protein NIES4073_14410 [Scytonema sp. NIES-4073]